MGYHNNRVLLETAKSPGHQQDVDSRQAQLRADMAAGRRELFRPAATPLPEASHNPLDARIAEELALVVRQLEHVGNMLAGDPILLHRYATQLQSIDLMQQVLGHLGRVVSAADREAAVERVTLTELKGRLKRAPLRAFNDGLA